jgi:hypothetical protein
MEPIDGREFRLRPPPARRAPDETKVYASAFRRMIHLVRMSSPKTSAPRRPRAFSQWCAIRVTYLGKRTQGQWAAHGRYVAPEGEAFDKSGAVEDLPALLRQWQRAGDPRLFKIIISPEFGERADLEKLTRDLMERMEKDLGSPLEWAAVTHRNTDHLHVHVALRGMLNGEPLRLRRDYVRHGIRTHAEELCTAQLGIRTALDAEEARRREVTAQRFTSLDRMIARGDRSSPFVANRLRHLETMGLAKGGEERPDFEAVLRAMQRATDRQRALAGSSPALR